MAIRVKAFYQHIPDVFSKRECGIGGQCPGCGCPGQECDWFLNMFTKNSACLFVLYQTKLGHNRGVFNLFVGSGHVQLVRAQACTRGGRIWLDGVALVEQAFIVKPLEQPPYRLDVFVVVGNIRVIHIDPITHSAGKVVPDAGKLHYILPAGLVVLFDGELNADVFFGDAQGFFYAKLNGQPMGVPTGLAFHLKALKRFVAAEQIFNGARHHVVNAGQTIGRGRAFVKVKGGRSLAAVDRLFEDGMLLPPVKYFVADGGQVQMLIFRILHGAEGV